MKCWGIEDTEGVLGLKSSARMCICGKCLFLLSRRYISSAEQIVLISTPSRSTFMLLFDVRLRSNI